MTYTVIFALEARLDLADLFDYLAERTGEDFARAYINRIVEHCRRFDKFPKRGTPRNDIEPGLRLVGYKHRATIAFRVEGDTVVIARFLYAGRSLSGAVDIDDEDDAS